MLKFPLFVLKLVITGTALISDVRAADSACLIDANSFQDRARYINVQSQLATNQIADSEKAITDLMSQIKSAKRSKIVGDIINGVVSVASLVVPGLATIKNWATDTGIPFLEKVLKSKPGKTAANDSNPGLIVLIEGRKIYARDAAEALVWIETRLEELEKLSYAKGNQLVDYKMAFLTQRCTENSECPGDSVELEELLASLVKWYQKAGAQKATAETHLAFVKTTVRLLQLKQSYFKQLNNELHERATRVCKLTA